MLAEPATHISRYGHEGNVGNDREKDQTIIHCILQHVDKLQLDQNYHSF